MRLRTTYRLAICAALAAAVGSASMICRAADPPVSPAGSTNPTVRLTAPVPTRLTNAPVAPSLVNRHGTNLSTAAPDPNDPVEKEYKKLMADDDAAQAEVDQWIRDNNEFAAKGAGVAAGDLNRRIEERFDPIRRGYEDFLRRHPDHARARVAYGSFLGDMHDEDGAQAQLEKALELDTGIPSVYNNLANIYGHHGSVKKAFEYYAKAIELNPNEPVYYHNFGTTVYLFRPDAMEYYNIPEQKVFDKALDLYAKAVRLDPTNFPLASDVAQTYYGIKPTRTEDALKAWTNTLSIAHDEIEREGVYLHFARIKLHAQRFAEARAHLSAVTNEMYETLKSRLTRNLIEQEKQAQGTNAPPPVDKLKTSDYPIQPVPFTAVRVADGFWSPRMETNRITTVWYDFRKCEETGRIDNFAKAGKLMPGAFRGTPFDDSDVFKVIEGAAYTLAVHPDPKLDRYLDDLIVKIAAAQEPDGYLYTARTIDPNCRVDFFGPTRWSKLVSSHELYNVGHLYEAAVAHFQATGKRSLLNVALKNADLVCKTFGPAPGQLQEPPGHEEIEIGLVKLFRATGEPKYLDQARYFCGLRGRAETHKLRGAYQQDDKPIVEQSEAVGHSVRAGYFYSGVADVAALTGDAAFLQAIDRIWENVIFRKIHLTGGIGALPQGEAFGAEYELPNAGAYLETCAAIANALWNERMFLLHGDAKYLDVLERVIYNGFLSGVSLTGDRFFYPNPLESDGKTKFNHGSCERAPWFGCSCCPVNDVRFIPEIASFIYATRGNDLFVNLFIGGSAKIQLAGKTIELKQVTRYPWDGKVALTLTDAGRLASGAPGGSNNFTLNLRIPCWTGERPLPGYLYRYDDELTPQVKLAVNDLSVPVIREKGFAQITRAWNTGDTVTLELEMPVRRVVARTDVKADRDCFAVERGPLVYCAEGADNGGKVLDKVFSGKVRLETSEQPDLLGGIVSVKMTSEASGPALACIPYYAWCHRGPNEMRVWFPTRTQ